MAAKDAQSVVNEIHAHMRKQGGSPSSWYVGITSDIEQRLFGDHGVPKENHWYCYRETFTSNDARSVEKAFLDYGCDGGSGGGDDTSTFVYAYLKTSITKQ